MLPRAKLAPPDTNFGVLFAALFWLLKRYPWTTAGIIFLMLLAGIAEGFGIVTLLPLIGVLTGKQSVAQQSQLEQTVHHAMQTLGIPSNLEVLLLGLIIAMVLKAALTVLAMSRAGYATSRISADLRRNFIRSLMAARWSYFLEQPSGSIVSTMNQEAGRGANAYASTCNLIVNLTQVMIYAGIAMLVSAQATVLAILLGAVTFYLLRGVVFRARNAAVAERESLRNLMVRLIDGLTLIKPLKTMALENRLAPILEKETSVVNQAQRKQVFLTAVVSAVQEPILAVFLAGVLYLATTVWEMSFAQMVFMAILVQRVIARTGGLQSQFQKLTLNEPALSFIREAIKRADDAYEVREGNISPEYNVGIKLSRINFDYGNANILVDLSLFIPHRRFVAIIGPSGSGKTTIVDLISGMLRPQSGAILVDGQPLTTIDMTVWRQNIGYVPQDTFLLHGTISNNVTLGDASISDDDVKQALTAAGASEFVHAREDGIESVVGERGGKLSGGQRQRISLARALVRRPRLLILDEPTSGMDAATEAEILKTLRILTDTVTVVVISHQPAVSEAADIVYRLANGAVVDTRSTADVSA